MSSKPTKVVVRDNEARLRAAAYFSLPLLFIVAIVFTIPLLIIYQLETPPTTPLLVATGLTQLAVLALVIWWAGERNSWRDTLGLKNYSHRTLLMGGAIGLAFFLVLQGFSTLLPRMGVEVGNSDTTDLFAALPGVERVLVLFLGVSFLVPIIEELYFRGYVLGFLVKGRGLEERPRRDRALLLPVFFSAAMFSLVHFQGLGQLIDFVVLGYTFLFAATIAYYRIATGCLYPAIAAHVIYNGCSAVAIMFLA